MQNTCKSAFHRRRHRAGAAFTLMETVIAIGVLAVLLTGFIAVFTPAAQGIRRSISSQQADRLTSALERELVTARNGQAPATNQSDPATAITGFKKGFTWLSEGRDSAKAIFVYQYRGNPAIIRPDGTMAPVADITGKQSGIDYVVQSMARRLSESELQDDLNAVEGPIFFVKPTQLIFKNNELVMDDTAVVGKLKNPAGAASPDTSNADTYEDAVIAFSAEFHSVPTKSFSSYLNTPAFKGSPDGLFYRAKNPVFSRNLAIRR